MSLVKQSRQCEYSVHGYNLTENTDLTAGLRFMAAEISWQMTMSLHKGGAGHGTDGHASTALEYLRSSILTVITLVEARQERSWPVTA